MSSTFTGSVSKRFLWQSFPLIPRVTPLLSSPDPDTGFSRGTGGDAATRNYDPFNQIITWEASAPSFLNNKSLAQLWSSPEPNVLISTRIVYSVENGIQTSDCGNIPNINLNVYRGISQEVATNLPAKGNVPGSGLDNLVNYCSSTECPTFEQTTIPQIVGDIRPYEVQANPWNERSPVKCDNHGVSQFTFTAQLFVTLTVTCETAEQLETGFCPQFCNIPANQQTCFDVYRQYCLVDTNSSGEINIFSSSQCQTFIPDYIQNVGPTTEIDTPLTAACTAKYPGFDDLERCTGTKCLDICACHMSQTLYDNLRQSIIAQFPGFQYVAENERCLYPPCASSDFTTNSIGKQCALPGCIDIAVINNNGTIQGGTTIKQDPQCVNTATQRGPDGGGDTSNQPTEESWFERHWVWIVLGVGIVIVLIIIILIVLAGENNKKKPQLRLIPE